MEEIQFARDILKEYIQKHNQFRAIYAGPNAPMMDIPTAERVEAVLDKYETLIHLWNWVLKDMNKRMYEED